MNRNVARGVAMLLIGQLIAALALVAHAADPGRLDTSFDVKPESIVATGTLFDARGKPVRKAEVVALVDGRQVDRASTRGNGSFSLTVPMPGGGTPGKTYRVEVRFAGNDKVGAAVSLADYAVPAQPGQPQQPPPPQPPPGQNTPAPPGNDAQQPPAAAPTPTATQPAEPPKPPSITLGSIASEVDNGSLVTISGSLKNGDGKGIGDAGIVISDSRGEVDDSYTITNADGAFSTLYEIPGDASGAHQVKVTFPGGEGLPATSAELNFTVEKVEVQTAEPTLSPSPSTTAAPSDTPTATPTPSARTSPTNESTAAQPPAQPWFNAAIVAVGGLALLAVIGLGARAFLSHGAAAASSAVVGARGKRAVETSGLDFLDEEMDED